VQKNLTFLNGGPLVKVGLEQEGRLVSFVTVGGKCHSKTPIRLALPLNSLPSDNTIVITIT
jgi:hypothetical protein